MLYYPAGRVKPYKPKPGEVIIDPGCTNAVVVNYRKLTHRKVAKAIRKSNATHSTPQQKILGAFELLGRPLPNRPLSSPPKSKSKKKPLWQRFASLFA